MKKPLYMMYNIVLLIICLISGLYGVASAQPALHTLTVEKSGGGNGTVTSSPAGIKCGGQCFYDFGEGRNVNLTAKADAGSKFISWSGACNGTKGCSVAVSTDITATALFTSESNISISPVSKEFGNVAPGKTKSSRFKVTNKGSVSLDIGKIGLGGLDAGAFTIKTDLCSDKQIKPSASCSVTVLFAPDINTAGLKTATMTIPSNDPDTTSLDVTFTGRSSAKVSVSPAFKNFGVVVPGRSKSAVFKVFNKGTVEMDVANITFDGLNTNEFTKTADTCSNQHVQPSKYCSVTVSFTSASTAGRMARMIIPSDDPDTPILGVPLTGGAYAWQTLGAFDADVNQTTNLVFDGAGNPTIAYTDKSDNKLYVKSYSGSSWNVLEGAVSDNLAGYIALAAAADGTLYTAYQDYAASSKATVKSYSGGNWSLVGTAGFSNDYARGLALSVKDNTPYLAFKDYERLPGEDNDRISVMWDNGGWTSFGTSRFTLPINAEFALAVPPDGRPCVASHEVEDTSRHLYVYRYGNNLGTGGSWARIGTGGTDPWITNDSSAIDIHLVNDSDGGLYVSYTTQAVSPARSVVKKYNAITDTWDPMAGAEGYVDDGRALWNDLFCDGKNVYVAYLEPVAHKLVIKKFDRDSGKWNLYQAGKISLTKTVADNSGVLSLYVRDGVPYIAYRLSNPTAQTASIVVMKCQ
jgi:hypothetical protein